VDRYRTYHIVLFGLDINSRPTTGRTHHYTRTRSNTQKYTEARRNDLYARYSQYIGKYDRGLETILAYTTSSTDCMSTGWRVGVCMTGRLGTSLSSDHLIPASDAAPRRLRLRSSNLNRTTVPRCRLSTHDCRAFYHADPTVWNSLTDELRNSDIFDGFKRFLKTILFSR